MYVHEHEPLLKSNHGSNPNFETPVTYEHVWIRISMAHEDGNATLFQCMSYKFGIVYEF